MKRLERLLALLRQHLDAARASIRELALLRRQRRLLVLQRFLRVDAGSPSRSGSRDAASRASRPAPATSRSGSPARRSYSRGASPRPSSRRSARRSSAPAANCDRSPSSTSSSRDAPAAEYHPASRSWPGPSSRPCRGHGRLRRSHSARKAVSAATTLASSAAASAGRARSERLRPPHAGRSPHGRR